MQSSESVNRPQRAPRESSCALRARNQEEVKFIHLAEILGYVGVFVPWNCKTEQKNALSWKGIDLLRRASLWGVT